MRTRVYVAGPLSTGDREANVAGAIKVGRYLITKGYSPLVPHLTHYMDPIDDLGWENWLEADESWVAVADVVLRMGGESRGADREVAFATTLGIPVVYSLPKLFDQVPPVKMGDQRFHALLHQIGRLHDLKQQDYGSEKDPFANVRASERWGVNPWVGALIRANDKMHRLQQFAQKGTLANESARDSMLDGAVYHLIAAVLYDEASTSGRSPARSTGPGGPAATATGGEG